MRLVVGRRAVSFEHLSAAALLDDEGSQASEVKSLGVGSESRLSPTNQFWKASRNIFPAASDDHVAAREFDD